MTRLRGFAVLLALVVLVAPGPVAGRVTDVGVSQRANTLDPIGTVILKDGFTETTVWSGLSQPTAIRFAADGRAFVTQKNGQIKVYSSLSDPTPTTYSGLMTNTYDYWDHGLLGLALDPSLTGGSGNGDYLYVGYTYDHIIGDATPAPRWLDQCPTPPGPATDGCPSSSRISRLSVSGTTISGETVLAEGFCQQGPSHGMGSLSFGPDGSLYVTHGEGGLFNPEYGNRGGSTNPVVTPRNPCGDPPGGVGGAMTLPTAEGGWLRAQDMRTTADPAGLDGAVLRINPMTGAGVAGSPFAGSADVNARKIIAYGLRNPFRAAFRPGTNELWVADVGWNAFEEIDVVANATDSVAENFGWPCYEGPGRLGAFDAFNVNICENLYAQSGAVTAPKFLYDHANHVVADETCPSGGASILGMAFYPASGGSFPASYQGGLFFGDYSRNCIWFMPKGSDGKPNPAAVQRFYDGASHPVDIVIGPGGDLFYVDFDGGAIRRISPTPANRPPVVELKATPTFGPAPLKVTFDGSLSSDPEGTQLTFAWDLDGDGAFDDATGPTAERTYTENGNVTAGLEVTDGGGAVSTAFDVIGVGNNPPVPVITTPATDFKWHVGETISFSGSASDTQDGALPGTSLTWSVKLKHCPSTCHTHPAFYTSDGLSGAFTAPDHDYPASLLITLTAMDSSGTLASVQREILPETVPITINSNPTGLTLSFNGVTAPTPFTSTVIVGSTNTLTATTPINQGITTWTFASWSNGKGYTQELVAPAVATTYTATYKKTLNIPIVTDLYVRTDLPNTNFGSSMTLRVDKGIARTYVKFYVTGLTARPKLAKLRLWVTEGGPSGGIVYKAGSSWSESKVTWNTRPLYTGSAITSLRTVKTGTWAEFTVTSAVTGNGWITFTIIGLSTDNVNYASRESANDPVLVLTP